MGNENMHFQGVHRLPKAYLCISRVKISETYHRVFKITENTAEMYTESQIHKQT